MAKITPEQLSKMAKHAKATGNRVLMKKVIIAQHILSSAAAGKESTKD